MGTLVGPYVGHGDVGEGVIGDGVSGTSSSIIIGAALVAFVVGDAVSAGRVVGTGGNVGGYCDCYHHYYHHPQHDYYHHHQQQDVIAVWATALTKDTLFSSAQY